MLSEELSGAQADRGQDANRERYLDLMKKVLTNVVYEDAPLPSEWSLYTVFDPVSRGTGLDWPSQAHTMPGDTVVLHGRALPDFFPFLWACLGGGLVPLAVEAGADETARLRTAERTVEACALLDGPRLVTDAAGAARLRAAGLDARVRLLEVAPERLGRALALMSSSVGLGGALGFPLAAFMAQYADWHAVYWLATVTSAVNLLLVRRCVPASPRATGGRFDHVGAFGLTVVLTLLLLGISRGAEWVWTGPYTLGAFGGAAVTGWVWARRQLRRPEPLVDLRASVGTSLLATHVAALLVGFSMFALSMILPQLLQLSRATGYGSGLSMVSAGFCLAPAGVVMMLLSPRAAGACARWGARSTLGCGAAVMGLGYAAGIPLWGGVWGVVAVSVVVGAGLAFAFAAMPALIVADVRPEQTAAANGLNTLMRSIGMTVSSAVMTEILSRDRDAASVAGAASLVPSAAGFRTAFATAALAAVAAAALMPALRRRRGAGGSPSR